MNKEGTLRASLVGAFGCLLAAACVVITFLPVLPRFSGLVAGDSMPIFPYPWRTLQLEELLASGVFTPQALYRILLDPLWMHELTFIVDTLLLAGAGTYYLRVRGVHPLAALCGGLALGFSGYTFTLFSAGHRGYFHMISCAVWSFGLIARGFERRNLFYFAMLGVVMAWGAPYQPDVLLFVGALAGAYVLWLTFCDEQSRAAQGATRWRSVWSRVCQVWPRFVVSLLLLVLAGFGGLRAALTTQMAARDQQIAGVAGQSADGSNQSVKALAAEKRRRWLFATNWSLPPEDVLEFIVPGVFGNESMQGAYPYWGRLGRPDDSEFQKGRMMPNYRQHTVYLGVLQVLLALLAVICWWRSSRDQPADVITDVVALSSNRRRHPFSDVPFWCGVWVVCLILAMGRFTPVYRGIYAMPFMDYIRAPVKFHHLVEIATAILAGFGLDALLRGDRKKMWGRFCFVSVVMSLFLVVVLLAAVVAKAAIVREITGLGLAQVADTLGRYAVGNVGRSLAIVTTVCAAAFWVTRLRGKTGVTVMAFAGVAWLAVDQAWVARRYVKTMDLEPYYRANTVIKAAIKDSEERGLHVPVDLISYATQNTWQDWFSTAFGMNGLRNRAPGPEDQSGAYGSLFSALEKDPVRLWKILHVRYVIAPRKGLESLLKAGLLSPVMDFELDRHSVRQVTQYGQNVLTLARMRDTAEAPFWVADWVGQTPRDMQVETLVRERRTVSDAPAADGVKGSNSGSQVEVLSRRGMPGVLATRVKTVSGQAGLLVFDERMADNLEALIDGQSSPLYTADGVWAAVRVPAGEHEVVLRRRRALPTFVTSVCAAMCMFGWGIWVMLSGWKELHAGDPA